MGDRVSFSGQVLDLDQIAKHHRASEAALREYFSESSQSFLERYAGDKLDAPEEDLACSIDELNYNSAFNVLAAIEAVLRTDYLNRVYGKKRGVLSREFRATYKSKTTKASLEADILSAWRKYAQLPNGIYADLLGAFKYRHWLAHGRYWVPNFRRQYDYFTVSELAQRLFGFMDIAAADRNI